MTRQEPAPTIQLSEAAYAHEEPFQSELGAVAANREIGTRLWFTNDRVNVWEVAIAPGERAPFHSHCLDYFWVCVDPGRGRQRYPDGTMRTFEFGLGSVEFLAGLSSDHPAVHDLENIDTKPIRFVAVELK